MNLTVCRNFVNDGNVCINLNKIRLINVLYTFLYQDFKFFTKERKAEYKMEKTISTEKDNLKKQTKNKTYQSSYNGNKAAINEHNNENNFLNTSFEEKISAKFLNVKSISSISSCETTFFHTPKLCSDKYELKRITLKKIRDRQNFSLDMNNRRKKKILNKLNSPYMIKLNKMNPFVKLLSLNLDNSKIVFKSILLKLIKSVRFEESTLISTFVLIDRLYNKTKLNVDEKNVIINFLLCFVASFQINEDSSIQLSKILNIFSISITDFAFLQREFLMLMNYKIFVDSNHYDFYSNHIYSYINVVLKE